MSGMKRNYTSQKVFVGIDVHKKTYSVSAVVDGELVKSNTMTASPTRLVSYLQKFFHGAVIKSAYEAGFSGFCLHRHLLKNGIENIVVHAASIEISSRDRVKTDKRDSLKIATQLAAGRLNGIYVPSVERQDSRELTRLRDELVEDKTRYANRLKQKAHMHGLLAPNSRVRVSQGWIEDLLSSDLLQNLKISLRSLFKRWQLAVDEIAKVDDLLKEQAQEDQPCEMIYRSCPGVGKTAARVLANELEDMSRFGNERRLSSYVGLTPCEYSSGEHRRQGHISRQGKPLIRKILVQSAWVAVRYDKELGEIFGALAKRIGKRRAIVAIARRLIGRIRACFRAGALYGERPTQTAA